MRRWLPILLTTLGITAQAQAPREPPPPLLPAAQQADAIHVYKAQRRMDLLRGDQVIATYRIVLGGAPIGHKREQGDQRTPEGDYRITYRNARSRFHLSLRISYPDDTDRRQALAGGVDPGGDIMIHGATPPGSRASMARAWAAEQCLRMPSRVSKLRFRPSWCG